MAPLAVKSEASSSAIKKELKKARRRGKRARKNYKLIDCVKWTVLASVHSSVHAFIHPLSIHQKDTAAVSDTSGCSPASLVQRRTR